jgi:hypothetical protein
MRLDLKRDGIVIVPENEQDRAYLEDTLHAKKSGTQIKASRVDDVALGYSKPESFVVKVEAAS